MKKNIITNFLVVGTSSVALLFFALIPGTVEAASAATLKGSPFCDHKGTGICAEALNGNTSPRTSVVAATKSAGASQDVYMVGDNICNGSDKVTLSCPFKQHLGLNKKYKGDKILFIHWGASKTCIGTDAQHIFLESRDCGHTGTVWIKGGTYEYINRARSDTRKTPVTFSNISNNGDLSDSLWVSGSSQWAQ